MSRISSIRTQVHNEKQLRAKATMVVKYVLLLRTPFSIHPMELIKIFILVFERKLHGLAQSIQKCCQRIALARIFALNTTVQYF